MLIKNSICNNDNNSTCAYLGPPLRETCAMQVLDHGKNARIGPLLKTFLGFLDGSHICSCYLPLPNERHLINLKPLNKPALSLCQCERASNTLVFPKKKMCKGQAGLTKNGHLQKCHDDHLWGAGAWCKPGAPGCKADILPGHKVATAPTTRQQTHGAHFQSRKRSPQPRPIFCVKFLEIYMGHGRTATNSHRIGWWENV